VNRPESLPGDKEQLSQRVFVSYATADRKQALQVCSAIEKRGTRCWISCRDVRPGENYQEAIVHSIRAAPAMVLVFSDAANNSDEIKKELSLASKFHVPVMALRIEDVEPSDAFAYELSTRQWIDAFRGWDKSIDSLVQTLDQMSDTVATGETASAMPNRPRLRLPRTRLLAIAVSLAVLLVVVLVAWLLLKPGAAPAQAAQVRLAEFQRLSPNLPATMPDAIRDELASAFPQDGTINVSTASAPVSGNGPAYALSGTVGNDGDKIRGIARLADERSGETIWSKSFEYPAGSPDKLPHWFALDAASVVKCALSAAATYPKPLPQKTLTLYFGVCAANTGVGELDAARRVVQATPDFSAGWSAVGNAALLWSQGADSQRAALRMESKAAAEKALQIDPENAQAYLTQSLLLPHSQLLQRETLLKKAVEARPLACGCEHHFYGWFLWEVGRVHDAGQELFRAIGQEPFDPQMHVNLAELILIQGFSQADADEQYKIAADMVPDPEFLDVQKLWSAPITGDYRTALDIVSSGRAKYLADDGRVALIAAYKAVISGDLVAKQNAAAMLEALPEDHREYLTVLMLGALGANDAALRQMETWDAEGKTVRARLFLWYPSMRGVISDPSFPATAQRMGLMTYWKTTHTKPDVCSDKAAPPFCRMI